MRGWNRQRAENDKSRLRLVWDNFPENDAWRLLLRVRFLIDLSTSGIAHFPEKASILLVILFPRDTTAVTALDARDFWAFNEGMCEAQFSALGG